MYGTELVTATDRHGVGQTSQAKAEARVTTNSTAAAIITRRSRRGIGRIYA